MSKFVLGPDEHLYREGFALYLKSTLNIYRGDARITSKRFVYCKKNPFLGRLLGPIVKAKTIVFEIALANIVSVHKEKNGLVFNYILTQRDGTTFALSLIKQNWIQ